MPKRFYYKDRSFWLDLLVVFLLVSFVSIPSLLSRDLWNPDEPRYMEVTCEMVESGSYLIPQLNGLTYSEKPPLFFWLAGGLWKCGLGYNSGRVVSLIAVFGCLVLIYILVQRFWDRNTALVSVFMTTTTVFFLDYASKGVLDPLLMFFITGSMASGFLALEKETNNRKLLWLISYACMGLAILTKGPVGFIVPGLTLIIYRWVNKKGVQGCRHIHIAGICLMAAVVLVWLVPAIIAGGEDYAHTILIEQNFGRAVDSWSHHQPFYYYLIELPWRLLPWSLILPLALWAAWRKWRQEGGNLSGFALIWFIVTIVFFSLMSGKRGRYILPMLPAAGILCGGYFTSKIRYNIKYLNSEKWLLRFSSAFMSFVFLLLIIALLIIDLSPELADVFWSLQGNKGQIPPEILNSLSGLKIGITVCLLGVSMALALVGLFARSEKSFLRIFGVSGAMLIFSLSVSTGLFPVINTVKSGKNFGQVVKERTTQNNQVFLYRDNFSGMYNLYSGFRRMPVLQSVSELQKALSDPKNFVISENDELEDTVQNLDWGKKEVYKERVGHRCMVLLRGG